MKSVFLVLIDLVEDAPRVAAFAARLAVPVGAELVLLVVETPSVPEPAYGLMMGPVDYLTERPNIAAPLTQLARQLLVPATVEVQAGVLTDVLQQMLAQYQPQLLVLGLTAENSWLDRLLLNPALPVVRELRLPLVLVPTAPAHDFQVPQRVVVAVDGEPFHLSRPAQDLKPLLSSWVADFTVVHVVAPEAPTAKETNQALRVVRMSGVLPVGVTGQRYPVRHSSAADGVLQAADDIRADLLLLIARPRSFFGGLFHRSVTAEVVRRSTVPLLLLPAAEEPVPVGKPAPGTVYGLDYV